jgi:hydroxylaminobenzene mutase
MPAATDPTGARHPLDPDPVRSSKAYGTFALGLVGALTGFFLGGVVPATVGLLLARQARREAYASGGFLTGVAWVRRGERLAWLGIVLAAAALVIASVIGILGLAGSPAEQDFPPTVD